MHRVGPIGEEGRRVHTRDVLSDAAVRIDAENLLNKLVLTQVDVSDGNRRQEGLEDGAGARMVSREKGLGAQTQVFADVFRVGVPHVSRSIRERPGVINDSLRRTVGLPTGVALRRADHHRVDDLGSSVVIQPVQHTADECSKLWCGHGLEGPVEIQVRTLLATPVNTPSTLHSIAPWPFIARANCTSALRISSRISRTEECMPKTSGHSWRFKARFRRHAFGWRSQPAIARLQEAVSEIRQVARIEPILGAEGAVALLERISPALENVDSSSGAIGTAVNNTIAELVPILVAAPADAMTRAAWLDRLFEAHSADQIPYIERLADYWGELCGSIDVASAWADRLIGVTRLALSPDRNVRGYFHGTSACLSALFAAERYDELIELVQGDILWPYKRWAVKAMVAQGRNAEAIAYAESCRNPWASDRDIDGLCEQILLSSGQADEAYARYALTANRAGTFLGWFRAVAKKYPNKPRAVVLSDLVRLTPGDEGKWFAAAKDARLFDEAIALANQTPCDPKTLTRAARDFAETNPAFAAEAGLAALRWLIHGHGYEIASADVWAAYSHTIKAAGNAGGAHDIRARIRALIDSADAHGGFVASIIGPELGPA